jgi:hypothetical protein
MNFESRIENTKELIDWLVYLRSELKREIPGAELMWYDSVLHTTGEVKW